MPKILVCDDDRVVVHLITTRLIKAGAQVTVAYDAMQASMLAIRECPEAVLLDIGMPGGTGLMVLKRLKASMKTSLIPVVVISGTLDDKQREEVLSLGAVRVFNKPPNMDEIIAYLATLEVLPAGKQAAG